MKTTILTLGAAAIGLLPLSAQNTTTTETTEVTRNADGSTTTTTTTETFSSDARTRAVAYFDAYKGDPHGLPPAWAGRVRVKELPSTWRSRIEPGAVITETERSYLVDAPSDLVQVLPAASGGVRYYVAGGNVVAVDDRYRVVDSIQIPSIRFSGD